MGHGGLFEEEAPFEAEGSSTAGVAGAVVGTGSFSGHSSWAWRYRWAAAFELNRMMGGLTKADTTRSDKAVDGFMVFEVGEKPAGPPPFKTAHSGGTSSRGLSLLSSKETIGFERPTMRT